MFNNKTVLIMGLGLHGGGIGAANYFASKGARVIVTDLKQARELKESVEKLGHRERMRFVFGRHEYDDFASADIIIKNPGVRADSPYIKFAVDHGAVVETDIGIFLHEIRNITANIVGVTGTKGKSTTASIVYSIIKSRYPDTFVSGNITGSVFDIIDKVKKDSYVVLELSSFQLGGIADKGYSPRIGIFTNLMQDHLNFYNSMEDYFNDKSVIYRFQGKGDVLVVNRDNIAFNFIKPAEGAELITFGMGEGFEGEGSFTRAGKIYYRELKKTHFIMDTSSIKLLGTHNLYNILAGVAAAFREGFTPEEIKTAVSEFHGIDHRLEYVGSCRNIDFYNDSAATMPQAAIHGISSFRGDLTLIAGGSDKNLDLSDFARVIDSRVNLLVLLAGTGTDRLVRCLKKEYTIHGNLESAVEYAFHNTRAPGTVLLSPGFTSFGMFKNEFHRGNEFRKIVLGIIDRGH